MLGPNPTTSLRLPEISEKIVNIFFNFCAKIQKFNSSLTNQMRQFWVIFKHRSGVHLQYSKLISHSKRNLLFCLAESSILVQFPKPKHRSKKFTVLTLDHMMQKWGRKPNFQLHFLAGQLCHFWVKSGSIKILIVYVLRFALKDVTTWWKCQFAVH